MISPPRRQDELDLVVMGQLRLIFHKTLYHLATGHKETMNFPTFRRRMENSRNSRKMRIIVQRKR